MYVVRANLWIKSCLLFCEFMKEINIQKFVWCLCLCACCLPSGNFIVVYNNVYCDKKNYKKNHYQKQTVYIETGKNILHYFTYYMILIQNIIIVLHSFVITDILFCLNGDRKCKKFKLYFTTNEIQVITTL